jgi:hypothetical protein
LIYLLIIASEPVSEALLPIYNQLLTLRRCLVEVKKSGGVSSARELYPYSMKVKPNPLLRERLCPGSNIISPQLNSIDNMKVDGKFMVGSDIPDGQGSVAELLAECFDLLYDLRTDADTEKEEEEKSDEDDDDDSLEIGGAKK